MRKATVFYVMVLMVATGCRVGRFLPPGEKIYAGSIVKIENPQNVKPSPHALKRQLQLAARPKANKFFLGQPYQAWWWYVIGASKKPNKTRAFLRNWLGEEPVLSNRVNTAVVAQNMTSYLDNIGYFNSTVTGDTINKKNTTKAVYKVVMQARRTIRNINWIGDSNSVIIKVFKDTALQKGIIKKGMPYRLNDIDAERERLDLLAKSKGYYFFNAGYITAYADSTIGNNEVDLFFRLSDNTPETALTTYTINSITVYPDHNLLQAGHADTLVQTLKINGIIYPKGTGPFKPFLFEQAITYRPGKVYSSIDQNVSLNRLINSGSFKFVKNVFEVSKDSAPAKINVAYYLTHAEKKSVLAEVNGFSKENRFIGTQAGIGWKNKNMFGGSEQLLARVYGNFELAFNDSAKTSNNFRFGTKVALNAPRYIIPFFKIRENNLYPSRTQFSVGYEYFLKQTFYSKNIVTLGYEFQWKKSANKQQVFSPFSLTYINTVNVSDSFYKAVARRPALISNINKEAIVSAWYTYTFNTLNPSAKKQWFIAATIEAAGNAIGLLSGAKTPRSKNFLGAPFAQYVKADIDIRFTKLFRNQVQFNNRFQIGASLPYNNSSFLPTSKQYIIGGGSSMRAFSVKALGPGSYLPNEKDKIYFQIIGGDYKLLLNSELRIPLGGRFSAAVFTDVGNIWTKDSVTFGKAGQLKKDFLKELAVASGIGIRIDATLVLLRLDIGIPLRVPYLPEGQRWVIDKINIWDKNWRSNNLNFNFSIGYPF